MQPHASVRGPVGPLSIGSTRFRAGALAPRVFLPFLTFALATASSVHHRHRASLYFLLSLCSSPCSLTKDRLLITTSALFLRKRGRASHSRHVILCTCCCSEQSSHLSLLPWFVPCTWKYVGQAPHAHLHLPEMRPRGFLCAISFQSGCSLRCTPRAFLSPSCL